MLKITEKKDNPLCSRKEIKGELTFAAATPSNEAVAKEIATSEKVDGKLVKVKLIHTKFGDRRADVTAYIYDSEASFKNFEEVKKKIKAAAPAEGDNK